MLFGPPCTLHCYRLHWPRSAGLPAAWSHADVTMWLMFLHLKWFPSPRHCCDLLLGSHALIMTTIIIPDRYLWESRHMQLWCSARWPIRYDSMHHQAIFRKRSSRRIAWLTLKQNIQYKSRIKTVKRAQRNKVAALSIAFNDVRGQQTVFFCSFGLHVSYIHWISSSRVDDNILKTLHH